MKFCSKCGKEILEEAVICPGCGCAVEGTQQTPPTKQIPKSAKRARLFGILELLLLAPFGIPGIIYANKSKAETGGVMCGAAKAGLVCSIIGLCWWGLNLVLLLVA